MMGTTIPGVFIIPFIPPIIKPPIIIPFLRMKPVFLFLPPSQMMSIMTNHLLQRYNNFIPTQHPHPFHFRIPRQSKSSLFVNAVSTDGSEFILWLSVFENLAPFTMNGSMIEMRPIGSYDTVDVFHCFAGTIFWRVREKMILSEVFDRDMFANFSTLDSFDK